MAFDQSTRNRLQKFVSECHAILTEEFTRQLQAIYGLDPKSGGITEVETLNFLDNQGRQTATILRETLAHYLAGLSGKTATEHTKQALDRIVREQAFTVLNRLAALRMAEARGFLIESIAKGYSSKGFQLYKNLAGTALGETGDTYRQYLFSLFDEFSLDLAVLFDRHSPQGRLFPRESALLALLEQINHVDIEHLWAEDETIGWIYQYFNSQEERKQMRAESQAPRNSRELAVRNQFFTPRYVVEFLTDNTLGRIWYEMTQGKTVLVESCQYLVRRPTEIFLAPGETAPENGTEEPENLSQEELLKQPVYILHRPLKDPRDLLMLDPACGSMHFGLYAFDLFEKIYEEAWQLETELGPAVFERSSDLEPLQSSFGSFTEFQKAIPKLIIERNIHGVDIDPRAVQIAGLSLWQRAQRAWHQMGVKPGDRPTIRKSNIVCAEPMPGEKEMLKEFTAKLNPPVLGQLVETIFDKMELAGEAGTLLKIEEEIKTAIANAKDEFNQHLLLRKAEVEKGYLPGFAPPQQPTIFDFAELPDAAAFWETAEENILTALRDYADQAESDEGQKRLFADDAAKGFAFIDLCRKRFDVVLMNPPFGNLPESIYASTEISDIDALFVQHALHLLSPDGFVGVITNRTQLMKPSLADFRSYCLQVQGKLRVCADLGKGVLDALVETAAFVVELSSYDRLTIFSNGLGIRDKEIAVKNCVDNLQQRLLSPFVFTGLPDNRFAHWIHPVFLSLLKKNVKLLSSCDVAFGISTTDNFRYLRLRWEVCPSSLGYYSQEFQKDWIPLAKGGDYSPYFGDIHLVVDWRCNGAALRAMPAAPLRNEDIYGLSGLTFTKRTASAFAPRILPKNCIIEVNGPAIIPESNAQFSKLEFLGILSSRVTSYLSDVLVAAGDTSVAGSAAKDYIPGVIGLLPLPPRVSPELSSLIEKIVAIAAKKELIDETSAYFTAPQSLLLKSSHIFERFKICGRQYISMLVEQAQLASKVLLLIEEAFQLPEDAINELDNVIGPIPGHCSNIIKRLPVKASDIAKLSSKEIVDLALQNGVTRKDVSKNAFHSDRKLELISSITGESIEAVGNLLLDECCSRSLYIDPELSYILGIVFGRWSLFYNQHWNHVHLLKLISSENSQQIELINPFAPLPVCPPGMLQNAEGLPAEPKDLHDDYPLRISWTGILVDDRDHPEDIIARIREVLHVIWQENAEVIEQEACEVLGIKLLQDYFQRPTAFFAEHLKRYSKSRRQAPIYWPLQTPSCSYTLWIYYHRLNDQTLYTCVNDFIEPKLATITEDLNNLRNKTPRSSAEEKELATLADLEAELKDFRDELLRIAKFWKPNLNDGVQITAAPLWKLFQHKQWQKKLKETWEKLEKGDYDWAHLAYSIWPDRVLKKCHQDRSLAIAHDVENDFWEEAEVPVKRKGKNTGQTKTQWQPKQLTENQLAALIKQKTAAQK